MPIPSGFVETVASPVDLEVNLGELARHLRLRSGSGERPARALVHRQGHARREASKRLRPFLRRAESTLSSATTSCAMTYRISWRTGHALKASPRGGHRHALAQPARLSPPTPINHLVKHHVADGFRPDNVQNPDSTRGWSRSAAEPVRRLRKSFARDNAGTALAAYHYLTTRAERPPPGSIKISGSCASACPDIAPKAEAAIRRLLAGRAAPGCLTGRWSGSAIPQL